MSVCHRWVNVPSKEMELETWRATTRALSQKNLYKTYDPFKPTKLDTGATLHQRGIGGILRLKQQQQGQREKASCTVAYYSKN